ncbi:MAG: hypothetical protein RMI89_03285 [Gloeomargarita sp. SKYBB_i_bin120]|nr:hypothetical protein [Gloeomargarita sp. SKYG98]MCS7291985.1 hypothetical protein [Gloeomargarita sp. SKYB120]MDW8177545.1 hypothetical protein [Gloeomargarita sp. SKYBB_i_bin120]
MKRLLMLAVGGLVMGVAAPARADFFRIYPNGYPHFTAGPNTLPLQRLYNEVYFGNTGGYYYQSWLAGQAQTLFNLHIGRLKTAPGGPEIAVQTDVRNVSELNVNIMDIQGQIPEPTLRVQDLPNPYTTSLFDLNCRPVKRPECVREGVFYPPTPAVDVPVEPFAPPPPIRGRG